jgi:cytochrome c556
MRLALAAALGLALGLAACGPKPPPEPALLAGPKPVASLQELMKTVVAPGADLVWKLPPSVADPDSKAPPEQKAADWAKVEAGALALAEAANLIALEGRAAVRPGARLQDEGLEGNLPSDQINARMKSDRPDFLKFALALQAAALKTQAAAAARNSDGVLEAGGEIDEACEACHKQFWYPAPPAAANAVNAAGN